MPRHPLPDPIKHCARCGSLMTRIRMSGRLEDMTVFKKKKYCNQGCMAAAMTGVIKVLNEKNSYRQSARARESSCVECGSKKSLHVHHVDQNPLNNSQSNLKTLCARCHKLTHLRLSNKIFQHSKSCSLCSHQARHNGLCSTHYSRMRRHGDPHLVRRWNGHGTPVILKVL